MKDDADQIDAPVRQDAEQLEARLREDAEAMEQRLRNDPGQVREWIRQDNLMYGALIGIGVVIMQPFLTAASLDLPATICVVAFSLAIPLLAALVLLNEEEAYRRRPTRSRLVGITKGAATSCAFVGVVAAFWHILWFAGVGVVAAAIVGLAVYSVGFDRLERGAA